MGVSGPSLFDDELKHMPYNGYALQKKGDVHGVMGKVTGELAGLKIIQEFLHVKITTL